MIPSLLYHGSMYKQTELMPGFKRSGKLVKWDKTESNEYLYATDTKEEAIGLGFASAVEKVLGSIEFHINDKVIKIKFENPSVNKHSLNDLDVYVYSIKTRVEDNWIEFVNKNNSIEKEFKTLNTIATLEKVEKVDLEKWLSDKEIIFLDNKPAFEAWK